MARYIGTQLPNTSHEYCQELPMRRSIVRIATPMSTRNNGMTIINFVLGESARITESISSQSHDPHSITHSSTRSIPNSIPHQSPTQSLINPSLYLSPHSPNSPASPPSPSFPTSFIPFQCRRKCHLPVARPPLPLLFIQCI